MKLPFTKEEAEQQWKDFERYLVEERYAVRDPKTGEPLEHTYDDVLQRVTKCFKNEDVRKALLDRRIITATPFLMNGGNPHTNRAGYYSCYPLGDVEDSTDSIFQMERNLATIFQHAGGGGIDVSNLRPAGSMVDNGQGNASGPVSFAKGYSHLSSRISQGGKRRGALMIQMDHTHPDIKKFVIFKGDSKGVFTGCNCSVNVNNDDFWNNEELIDLIAEYMWKSGDPGLLFTQRSLKNTPVPSEFNPVFSNPCGEYLSIKDTACNLLSVNLSACTTPHLSDINFYSQVVEAARLAAIAGNEILDMGGFPPIPEIKEATLKHRPIGIGFTGLHAAMVSFGIEYNSDRAIIFTRTIQACLMIGSMVGSRTYEDSTSVICEWDTDYMYNLNAFIRFNWIELPLEIRDIWEDLNSYIEDNKGLPNCVTTSQAPTGSTSQLLHVSSTGIEPYFSMVQKRRIRTAAGDWKDFTLVPLEFYDYDEEKLDWIEKQTAHNISPEQQIKILEAVQTFCHTGVSKTINMPASATVEDVKAVIMRAKDSNIKGLTIFRDSSMEGVLSDATDEKQPDTTVEVTAPDTPFIHEEFEKCKTEASNFKDQPSRNGTTYKFSGPSSLYITVNFDDDGEVMEVFVNATKPGTTASAMCNAIGRIISISLQHDPTIRDRLIGTISDISSDGLWTNPIVGRAYSIPAAVAKVLQYYQSEKVIKKKYEKAWDEHELKQESSFSLCPACGMMTLRRNGGCSSCNSCGYSSC